MPEPVTRWCIVRTSGSRTLALAQALRAAGYNAWTPTETVTVERTRPSRGRVIDQVAITPSFVFVDRDRLTDLIALSHAASLMHRVWDPEQRRMVLRGIPHFTVFRAMGLYPSIADKALDPLRRIEREARPKTALPVFKAGDAVRYPDAGFQGLAATVVGMKGRNVLVEFAGLPLAVQVDPRHLLLPKDAA